ncbi:hypothetical protein AMATHDRAFT_8000 [Amanita thiersii Skay4041]|uniref:Hydrophobin n=1 Tax=Amanita thiersii Skay4041 TaxID=703135 RepID=A0A2A9NF10_9AGAR|nr:hypothetical protein AMATHDRAFT_8000 [Amanita thiersii Skay4041]
MLRCICPGARALTTPRSVTAHDPRGCPHTSWNLRNAADILELDISIKTRRKDNNQHQLNQHSSTIASSFKMYSALLALFALPALVVAGGGGQCNTGSLYCCEQTQNPKDAGPSTITLLKSVGVDVNDLTALIGLNCDPISVVDGSTWLLAAPTTTSMDWSTLDAPTSSSKWFKMAGNWLRVGSVIRI